MSFPFYQGFSFSRNDYVCCAHDSPSRLTQRWTTARRRCGSAHQRPDKHNSLARTFRTFRSLALPNLLELLQTPMKIPQNGVSGVISAHSVDAASGRGGGRTEIHPFLWGPIGD